MKIKVKYFGRRIEGRKAPEDWLHDMKQREVSEAYERAKEVADQLSMPNEPGDDWDAAFDAAFDRECQELDEFYDKRRNSIYFQDEDICGCCEQQVGAVYPWDREEEHSSPSYYNYYGDCEACVLGCCECIEDHA